MKYLKKHLPFANAGSEVKLINNNTYNIKGDSGEWFSCEIPDERFSYWIEEVKPREWYVVKCKKPRVLWTKEERDLQLKKLHNVEFIKVREVEE